MIDGEVGDLVTLLPVGGTAQGIVTSGLEYPLARRVARARHDARRQQRHAVTAGDRRRRHGHVARDPTRRFVVIVDIEVVPQPLGTDANRYAHVEAAIALAQESGLHAEVNALGTTIEGPPDALWPLVRAMHESCLASGAEHVITIVKFAEHADPGDQPTIDGLTGKFRS